MSLFKKNKELLIIITACLIFGAVFLIGQDEKPDEKSYKEEYLQAEKRLEVKSKKIEELKRLTDSLSEQSYTVTEYDTITGKPIKKIEWKTKTKIKKVTETKTVKDTVYLTSTDTVFQKVRKREKSSKYRHWQISGGLCQQAALKPPKTFISLQYSQKIIFLNMYTKINKVGLNDLRGASLEAGIFKRF